MSLDDKNLQGFDELFKNLGELEAATEAKVLRQAAGAALTPVVKKQKAAAPVGKEMHRTHKGRLVAPGFLSRSIKKRTFVSKTTGSVHAVIGVLAEAWYGLLYDTGFRRGTRSKEVKKAGRKGKLTSEDHSRLGDGREEVRGTGWFTNAFVNDRDGIEQRFAKHIKKRIDKIRAK